MSSLAVAPPAPAAEPVHPDQVVEAFIARWQGVTASELSSSQSFLIDLCELLQVPRPHPTPEQDYMFERPLTFRHGDGSSSAGRVDLYRRGCFVLESKKLDAGAQAHLGRTTRGFDDALMRARSQAEGYARALPASEGRPPFLVVVDVGHVFELYAEFTRSGATYTPFPDPRSHRIRLQELRDPAVRERLRRIWLDPLSLDPARVSAKVTRAVSGELAALAASLEHDGHAPDHVAAFLCRCLFSMFAEDVGLLPDARDGSGSFLQMLRAYREEPDTLRQMLRIFWQAMDAGGFNAAIAKTVLRFNGKLFKGAADDRYVLPLSPVQIDGLIRAASANWREVEPAIFGTLLERALDTRERHALGAHYTPRAYVERLVLPTVIEPLRADWADAQAAAAVLVRDAAALDKPKDQKKREELLAEAVAELRRFHDKLCNVRVLDPACGSGNFLYVTLEHLKRLEGEVLNQLHALGASQTQLGYEGHTVTLQQLRGIELNPRAAALAELVLWVGWLQWQIRTGGVNSVAEPVVHDYGNIECRDALLVYDSQEPARDAAGQLLTRWDGVTFKTHPTTGEQVPDERAQAPKWGYVNPRPAEWPQADFIVGNPPFIGSKRIRTALGDGYFEALQTCWPNVPDTSDFVMFWWEHAAHLVRTNKVRQFGFITTNSLKQILNRKIVERHLTASPPLGLRMAIPDHPWVDSTNGAAVRIAMTVGALNTNLGILQEVIEESTQTDGEIDVKLRSRAGTIGADLRIGAAVSSATVLKSNSRLCWQGCKLVGAGFQVSPEQLDSYTAGEDRPKELLRRYWAGGDITKRRTERFAIDTFGLTEADLRTRFPAAYQWLRDRVWPERRENRDAGFREKWWLFGRPRPDMRAACAGLLRYIVTSEVSKHRSFTMLSWPADLIDGSVIAIATSSYNHLGVLSSTLHATWALAAGGRMGVGNDPRYNNDRCFGTFPFPDDDTGMTKELATRISSLAQQIDDHRKERQALNSAVTLTGLYNVLEKLRRGEALTDRERVLHEQGLVAVLQSLHDDLDAAVLSAYGWADLGPVPWSDDAARHAWTETILERLVDLNTRRAAEEAQGRVRWLRPEFQDPARHAAGAEPAAAGEPVPEQGEMDIDVPDDAAAVSVAAVAPAPATRQPWPPVLPEQVRAVAEALAAAPAGLDLDALAASFTGRGPWKKRLPQILDTLVALGRARVDDGTRWRAM